MKVYRWIYLLLLSGFLSVVVFNCSRSDDVYIPNAPSYVVESIPTPPGLKVETGAIDFFPDGRLVAGFWRGEIMTYDVKNGEWSVFAKGFHNPLGILVINNFEILVAHHPELTRVIDKDQDGEAEVFENITSDFGLSGNFNEFMYGPVQDSNGNLYIALNLAEGKMMDEVRGEINQLGFRNKYKYSAVPYRGWVMQITPEGKLIPFASGFRSPDGIGFDDDGNLLVVDQQGDWVGTTPVYHVKKDHFYGHPSSLVWKEGWNKGIPTDLPLNELDSMRTKAAVLLPHGVMSYSATQIVSDKSEGKFGPFSGQLFIGEMNTERIIRVIMEEVNGELQGACIPFMDGHGLRKGNHRLAFGPDGSLWIGQNAHGWPGDDGIQRIRFTGQLPMEVQKVNLTKNGFNFTFTKPINKSNILAKENFDVSSYYYEYHPAYGSDRFGLNERKVETISISEDRRMVNIELDSLERNRIYQMKLMDIYSESGDTLINNLACYTVNTLIQ